MTLTTKAIIAAAVAAATLLAGPASAAHERKLAGMAPYFNLSLTEYHCIVHASVV